MDHLSVDKFEGLYTNVDERKLNPSFQSKALNVRFKTGSVETDGYIPYEVEGLTNVLYCCPVKLDEDRLGTKLVGGVIVPDYQQNFRYYLLTVTGSQHPLPPYHYTLRLDDNFVGYLESLPKKVIESDGILKILTEDGTLYVLRRIKRFYKGNSQQTIIPFYLSKIPVIEDHVISNLQPSSGLTGGQEKFLYLKCIGVNMVRHRTEYEDLTDIYYHVNVLLEDETVYEDTQFQLLNLDSSIVDQFYSEHIPVWEDFRTKYPLSSGDWNDYRVDHGDTLFWVKISDFNILISFTQIAYDPLKTGFTDKYLCHILITTVYDDTDEVVQSLSKFSVNPTDAFLISGSLILSDNFDKRLTAIGVYVKFRINDDFEQVAMSYISSGRNDPHYLEFVFDNLSPTGIYLSQNIGIFYDEKTYKLLNRFQDYIEISNISYSVVQSRVYYCSIGKGIIMKGLFYDYIPEVEGNHLVDIDGSLGVFGNQLKLIQIEDSKEGYLLFSEKDQMNFTIRDQYDYTYSPEGIIIHTNRGIYVTNGFERKLISEQVNDIIEENFQTGNIFYDKTNDMLFYICQAGCLRYDFVYSKWNEVFLSYKGILTFSETGEIYLNSDGKVYKVMRSSTVFSQLKTPLVDLGFPKVAKSITYVLIDFKGKLWYGNYYVEHGNRKVVTLSVAVRQRNPSSLLGVEFAFKGEIYSIDIYYDILGEIRSENTFPSPETYPEGLPKTPEFIEAFRKETEGSPER